MKKILAIVLALCLALSLSMTAFASTDSAEIESPAPTNPGTGSASTTTSGGKYEYTVTTASGVKLTADVQSIASGDVYNELSGAGVVALYYINITSAVSADEVVTIDVYAPGVSATDTVLVRDAWEVLPEVTFTANGNRAAITGPAGVFNTWHYVAIVSNADVVVETPQESTGNDEEEENVGDEAPEVDAGDEEEENNASADDANPGTGLALAVVPMVVAAAAVVVSKRRQFLRSSD